ncbi:ABC transporter ATP-binding protein [Paenibacillus sp. Y412MC10]|uniref:ABC transporter ATP-binding protein n=1 Tax=Geobacillus sp. (strain Y412MC10) TaxID=481743 RepID=UPI00017898BC|nr:ABC transporter ATP-binding protein [Paenibacillus sp. Y412MC10]ACX66133.1 ABC transporter related protein [Paenibacillus sp. Y412MC10]
MKYANLMFEVMKQVYRVSPRMFTRSTMIYLMQAFLPVAQIYITAQVIDAVTGVLIRDQAPYQALYWLLLQMAVILIGHVLASLQKYTERKMNAYVSYWFNLQVSEKLSKLPFVFFESPESYDKLQRALRNLNICGINMVFYMFSIIQNLITLTGLLVLLFSFHYILPIVMLLLIIPLLIIQKKEGASRFVVIHQQTASSRMAAYMNQLLQTKEAAKEIRLFHAKDYLLNKWRGIYFKNTYEMLGVERKNMKNRLIVEGAVTICSFSILAVFVWLGSRLKLTIGSYVALYQAVQDTRYSIQNISQNIGQIYHDGLFIHQLFEFLDTPVPQPEKALPMTTPLREGIEVDRVTFCYPNQGKPVLDDLTIRIKPGEKVAIVGENGAGKSTLVKIMLGLYEPTHGVVRYGGIPIQDYDSVSFRSKVTAVFQDFYRYEWTLEANIALREHDPDDRQAHRRLNQAMEKAAMTPLVDSLPDGVATQLGTRFSGGRELSQGQWQKVAIARAFYRDFEVIYLDEPTAAVDPLTESAIFESLMSMTEGKTAIFISHRLGSCRHADRILVLKEGRIVEEGKHEELIGQGAHYAEMFNKQAQWYR